ncbi:MAG: homoserine dehydrogenase [Eubacteriales bacterium]|nr:homoserine dehydrogenase [Clostridiales bacterium]MDY3241780.1 homoserine dehydrogenase [Eubacteriales bacterium]
MKKIGVALLGLGTVGGGTYRILRKNHELFRKNEGLDINVLHVIERNMKRVEELGVDPSIVSENIDDVVNNPDISIVCEFFGGIEPAKTFLIRSLEAGKSIVTANKELFSKHWPELEAAAKRGKAGLYFEASCVGGVPVIRTICEGMQANTVLSIKGIVNGTTNYILSAMSKEGTSYADALKKAQELGYAEANPSADVDGFDATYKLSILSTLAYHKKVPVERIYREGISEISTKDIAIGGSLGYTLKLLAISKNRNGKIEARVHPAFIKNEHPLASVSGSFNAVHMVGDSVGDIMMYGRGAGDLPTGSAIVSDIVYCAKQSKHAYLPFKNDGSSRDCDFITDFESKYYIRLTAVDKCGTLGKISTVFGKNRVGITTVLQKDTVGENGTTDIIFVTHDTFESAVRKALKEISSLEGVKSVDAVIRVED